MGQSRKARKLPAGDYSAPRHNAGDALGSEERKRQERVSNSIAELFEEWKRRQASEVSKQVSMKPQSTAVQNVEEAGEQAANVEAVRPSAANKNAAATHYAASQDAAFTVIMQAWKSKKIEVSNEVSNKLLLYTAGEIYILFFDDAILAARELGVTLHCDTENGTDIPFCSLPCYGGESYINQLCWNGYDVAILENPKVHHFGGFSDVALRDWSLPTEAGWLM